MTNPPSSVKRAVMLFTGTLLLGFLQPWFADTQVQRLSAARPTFAIMVVVFTVATLSLLLWLIYSGKNWARILFTVLFVLGILLVPVTLPNQFSASPFAGLISVVQIVLQVIALLWLYKAESSQWFKQQAMVAGSSGDDIQQMTATPVAAAMGIRVCSHCRVKVFPTSDGKCPSCQRSMRVV